MRLGVSFMNGIGNFIFFTSALKILKSWGYDDITLHTHPKFLETRGLMDISQGLFTDIIPEEPDIESYDHYLFGGWSNPGYMFQYATGWLQRDIKVHDFRFSGIHEVQLYLNMIGASWNDFDGYILEPEYLDIPLGTKTRIALANPDPHVSSQKFHKAWDKMPELSKTLIDLGYDVYLVGAPNEMNDCEGYDYTENTSILEMAGIIDRCDILIAPSTCAAILADAVQTPVLALEGPIMNSKTNPLMTPYKVIRHFIQCAPCFQNKIMQFCQDNICMKSISVGDVVQGLLQFEKDLKVDSERKSRRVYYDLPKPDEIELELCDKTMAYLFPCFERYEILKECLESFKESNPVSGAVLFLNDVSLDPRIQELIDDFQCDGLTKYVYQRDWKEKFQMLRDYFKTPSTHAYNFLLNELLELEKFGIVYDFVSIIDPDAVFKKNWSQFLINLYKEVGEDHRIGMISGLNYTNHPVYDEHEFTKTIWMSDSQKMFRLRNGANLHYMMTYEFFKNEYGLYPLITEKPSADVSKVAELEEKGYRTLVPVPSLMQQIGALGSSFSRLRSNEIAQDF